MAYGFERNGLANTEAKIRAWFHNNTGWMTRTRVAEAPAAALTLAEVPVEVHTAASDAEILFAAGIRPQSHEGQVAFDALAARQEAERLAAPVPDRDQVLNEMHDRGFQNYVC